MAKKDEKKAKKPAKTQPKEVKKVEQAPAKKVETKTVSKETKTIKKSEVNNANRETRTIKKSETQTVKKKNIVARYTKRKVVKEAKFEEKKDLDKLYVFFTIVNSGVADNVIQLFEDMGSSVSFVQNGIGTASEEVRKALHIQDTRKEVVISIIRESRLEDTEKELAAFFAASKRNKGVAFATKMDAIQGVRLYKFLSQTL